jgi:hypothetical protein
MAYKFVTVPDELENAARTAAKYLRRRGFKIRIEEAAVEYPSTPTLVARRRPATHFVFICDRFSKNEVDAWISYCRSCTMDVRVALFIPRERVLKVTEVAYCRRCGVGVYVLDNDGYSCLVQEIDLAFKAELPKRSSLNTEVRRLLGTALDKFENGDWREGFEDAVRVLEEECRKYLLKLIHAQRNTYRTGGKSKVYSRADINRMPLGALKDVVCNLLIQSSLESRLCAGITKLNPTRIARVHRASSMSTERRMRNSVGRDMWTIINLLNELHN